MSQPAKYRATSVNMTAWYAEVWIEAYKAYVRISTSPSFGSPTGAVDWATNVWDA